jgi:hypothetical protein
VDNPFRFFGLKGNTFWASSQVLKGKTAILERKAKVREANNEPFIFRKERGKWNTAIKAIQDLSRFENASDNLRNFGPEYAMSFDIQVNPVHGTKTDELSRIEKITTQPSGLPSIMASEAR